MAYQRWSFLSEFSYPHGPAAITRVILAADNAELADRDCNDQCRQIDVAEVCLIEVGFAQSKNSAVRHQSALLLRHKCSGVSDVYD